ncbi:ethanolamine ammonia-lyase subunit EutC [Sporolactobacillus sp. THM19-2]|uniref:ethanolamine ammonia-lyase subunit EutC n=1 Tax=Sporolactobacillus sp. THM19-2 TaxID=2511171 RepID=UPI00101FCF50|nr:ethanolamine ammonia-lyase subunit EutC [Sporolactobacillus sp. THM19-2]RYL88130.1 ethanolamine ammonia-lyase subunit EutC [Sporolactobacillus sp. THM19-2]
MPEQLIRDISSADYTSRVTITNPANMEACIKLKQSTNARICVGRAGTRYRTETLLKFLVDHAAANDSVWSNVDENIIDRLGFLKVKTLVKDKEEYIKRPDLGRRFSRETMEEIKEKCISDPDVQIIAADGLSAFAIDANIEDIYSVISDGVQAKGYKIGTPIFVKYGRVATMDMISEALNAKITVNLIGERPGLVTNESMSAYMAYESSTSKPESQRTVISNIYNDGTPNVEAGAQIVYLIELMMKEKKSGIDLKL